MENVRIIAFGLALEKFCPIASGADYIQFHTHLIQAERLIGFQHKGAYKLIKGQQEIKAAKYTDKGRYCGDAVAKNITKVDIFIQNFATNSPLLDEMVENHPKNPKPNQAFIFASYLQARQAWVYERKCKNLDKNMRAKLNRLMKKTRYDLELFFRPDQIGGLNKKRNERHIKTIIYDCYKLMEFSKYAIKVMEQEIPQAMDVLKNIQTKKLLIVSK